MGPRKKNSRDLLQKFLYLLHHIYTESYIYIYIIIITTHAGHTTVSQYIYITQQDCNNVLKYNTQRIHLDP